jgi:hypothetical protein
MSVAINMGFCHDRGVTENDIGHTMDIRLNKKNSNPRNCPRRLVKVAGLFSAHV